MYNLHERNNAAIGFFPAHHLAGFLILLEVESVVMSLLCHQLEGFWLKPVAASLCGIIHSEGNQKIFISLISKLILMLVHLFFITIVTNSRLLIGSCRYACYLSLQTKGKRVTATRATVSPGLFTACPLCVNPEGVTMGWLLRPFLTFVDFSC